MKWFVIHPDGQRYGPADADELRDWLDEKRAKRDTTVEDATTGERSTVADVLGLAPEIVEPDLSLDTVSDEAAPVVEVQPLVWPDEKPVVKTPEPAVSFEWKEEGGKVADLVGKIGEAKEILEAAPKAPPKAPPKQQKMSKASRTNYPAGKSKPDQLVSQSIAATTIGFIVFCCALGPIIGIAIASQAEKQGAAKAKGAKAYAIIMTVVTIIYWIAAMSRS